MGKRRRVENNVKKTEPKEPNMEATFGGQNSTTRDDMLELLLVGNLDNFKTMAPLFLMKIDKDEDGNSFLHSVVQRCLKDGYPIVEGALQLILREVPEMTCYKNNKEDTPLMLACQTPVCVDIIISLARASPQSTQEQNRYTHIPLICFLQEVKVGTKEGEISLDKCCEIIHLLSEHGDNANIEFLHHNSLGFVFQRHDLPSDIINSFAEILLKNGAKLISPSNKHAFAFLKEINFKLLELVMKYKPDEVLTNDEHQRSVVSYIIKALGNRHQSETPSISIQQDPKDLLKPLKIVLQKKISTSEGFKLIGDAVSVHCNFEIVKFLMQNTTHFNLHSNCKHTVNDYLLVQYSTCEENVTELLKLGVDVTSIVKYRQQALHVAAAAKCKNAVVKLLQAGASPLLAFNSCTVKDRDDFLNYVTSDDNVDILECIFKVPIMKDKSKSKEIQEYYYYLIDVILSEVNDEEITLKKLKIIVMHSQVANINFWKTEACNVFNNNIVTLDLLSYTLCHIDYKVNDVKANLRIIKLMLQAGFMIQNQLEDCLNPLTVFLLAVRNPKREYIDTVVLPIVDLLINFGVNFNSMALSTHTEFLKEEWITERCNNIKIALRIPDALFLSLWCFRSVELVQRFIAHWWGPPVALTAVLPTYQYGRWVKRFQYYNSELLPFLVKFGHVPYGTSLVSKQARQRMKYWRQGRKTDPQTAGILKTRRPLSLQDLCKYKVRHLLSTNIHVPQVSLPDLVNQVLPFDLPSTIHNSLL